VASDQVVTAEGNRKLSIAENFAIVKVGEEAGRVVYRIPAVSVSLAIHQLNALAEKATITT
jgi:hypothetical protein